MTGDVDCGGHYGPGQLREWAECPLCNPDDAEDVPDESSIQMGLRVAWWQGWSAGVDHAHGFASEDNPYGN